MSMECTPADLHRARNAAERACRHLVPSREDAEDCASEAITWALSHPESLQGVANVEGWLVTVARRKAIDMARDAGRRQRCDGRLQSWEEPAHPDHAEAVADRAEAAWVARRAEAALPARTHSVLSALSRGESVVEAADSLRLTPRAVESHLLRARRRMRTILTVAGAALGALAGGMRRGAPATAPLALAAFSVALLVHQGPTPAAPDGEASPRPPAVVTLADDAVRLPAVRPHVASRTSLPQLRRAAVRSRPSATIAAVETPAGPATVESVDRGGETGPVAAVMGCLDNLTVSPEMIGC